MTGRDERGQRISHVKVSWRATVATVLIDRPPVNALSSEALTELRAAFSMLNQEPTVRCVILSAGGNRCFVAGADITEAAATPPERASERTALGQALMQQMESLRVPVVVAINGVCLGAGCELAMAGDIRVASENARFGQPEVKLGIIPGFGGTQRLPRLVGIGPAIDLLLTGRDIDAAEALRLGLVSKVVRPEELQSEASAIAQAIASYSSEAVTAIKSAVQGGSRLPFEKGLELEFALSRQVRMSANAVEGLQAFVEKRRPSFGTA